MDDPDVEEGLVEQEERAEEGEDGDDGEDDKGKLWLVNEPSVTMICMSYCGQEAEMKRMIPAWEGAILAQRLHTRLWGKWRITLLIWGEFAVSRSWRH